jgi:hypothetical protein
MILFLRSFGNTGPGYPIARAVYCIKSLRQHLVHAFSSRLNSSTDFQELVDSICRAICSEYGIASTQTLGLFSSHPFSRGFQMGYKTLRARALVYVYIYDAYVYVYVHYIYVQYTLTEENNAARKKNRERENW